MKGYTFFEVIIVMALMASLFLMFVPWVNPVLKLDMLEQHSMLVIAYIQRNQQLASQLNNTLIIKLQRVGLYWQLQCYERSNLFTEHIRNTLFLDDDHIEAMQLKPNDGIIFYGRRQTSNGGHIVLTSHFGSMKIIISHLGRIRRCYIGEFSPQQGVPIC